MTIDFHSPVDRRGTASVKWDRYKDRDVLPLWLADMDFRASPAVIEALHRHVEHGVFGYTLPPDDLVEEVVSMLMKGHAWKVSPEWIVWLPGLVSGLNVACRAVGDEGDDVLTAVPVYPPFLTAPGHARRNLVTVDLAKDGNRWTFDFDRLEAAVTPRTRVFILCNPHNPVGRVFTEEELTALAGICERHGIVICSDEIHCGLILDDGKPHIPTATLDPEIARRTMTLMAPSKTYNLPGLGCSFAVIPDRDLRRGFKRAMTGIVPEVNALAYTAALAAYRDSREWRAALLTYLRENRDLLESFIAEIPGLSMPHVEATYLAWIETREAGLQDPAGFFEKAGVGLWDGRDFGGSDAVRLNFACHRDLLQRAMERMAQAMEDLAAEEAGIGITPGRG